MPKNDPRRVVSARQERDGVRRHGGRLQAGSGSGRFQKGDVRTDAEMFEYKTVLQGKTQITIKAVDLQQLEKDAVIEGRTPVFGVRVAGRDYVLLTAEDYEEMRL